jgi:hypothetical protein
MSAMLVFGTNVNTVSNAAINVNDGRIVVSASFIDGINLTSGGYMSSPIETVHFVTIRDTNGTYQVTDSIERKILRFTWDGDEYVITNVIKNANHIKNIK